MSDLFGFTAPGLQIGPAHLSTSCISRQKVELLLRLNAALDRVPPAVRDGSINTVNHWRSVRELASKIAKKRGKASIGEISTALNAMEWFHMDAV